MNKSIKKGLITLLASVTILSATAVGVHQSKEYEEPNYTQTAVAMTAILRQGSKGGEVKEVQRRLKTWGYYSGAVDGIFGAGTRKAVIAFQKKNGLTADGIVGKATYKALGMNSSYQVLAGQSGGGVGGYSSSDVYLLAKTIHAEGRENPIRGRSLSARSF